MADPVECRGHDFIVAGADDALLPKLCDLAYDTRDALLGCGLEQRRPLTIELVDSLSHPMGSCLAEFDCAYDTIRIVNPARYPSLLDAENAYAGLPEEVTLKALVSHEMAHALVYQGAGAGRIEMVDQEYIAAAMELELMADDWRDVFISAAPVDLPPKEGLIDIWIYGFAPRKFAVNAWQHFRLPENGCDLIHRLAIGEESFSTVIHPERR